MNIQYSKNNQTEFQVSNATNLRIQERSFCLRKMELSFLEEKLGSNDTGKFCKELYL